ncbi:hypothetical protein L914_18883 [Phytophthora nicotianae]|uniref:Uncharacterized protein n=1 Tax=Phytophthora nicotianae TaxID=4792 RepID=W2ME68_PHYNI|nr:hypothetical protein L914_18883 [Phytophthora nicotianae]
MLRRAIQRARLHLPAPIGHDNGGGGSSSDEEDFPLSPSVAYTSLRDDESVRDHFRKRPEDVSGVHLIIAEGIVKARKGHVAELSLNEQRRAADAWNRLQTLYGLFQELEAAADEDTEDSDTESVEAEEREKREPKETRRRRRRDDGLRSLLQEVQLPPGVIFRDLQTLSVTDGSDDNAMPQGFTAGMFAALGNAMYKEMLVAAEQNRISPDAFEELGNCLYAEAASVAVSATA